MSDTPRDEIIEVELGDEAGEALQKRVLAAIDANPAASVLILRAAHEPVGAAEAAVERGWRCDSGSCLRRAWSIALTPPALPPILDCREMEAPEPLERILLEASKLAPGEALAARTPLFPKMLLPQLERRALVWEGYREPDESGLILIRKPA